MSVIVACTSKQAFARYTQWWTGGYGHMAFVKDYGKSYESWVDSRFDGGVKERSPETYLHSAIFFEIPWDIEPGMQQQIGLLYNFHGLVAQWLHFRWSDKDRRFCDQALLVASRLVGYPLCPLGREDKVSPVVAVDMFWARTLGMTGEPPKVLKNF